MTIRSTRSPLLAAATLALAVPLLAGCQAFGINDQFGASYSDLEAMQASSDAVRIPALVPADAQDIRIEYNTVDVGAVLAFTAAGGITAEYCEPGPVDTEPKLEPAWWPAGELPSEGFTCGDWSVIEADGEFVVWN